MDTPNEGALRVWWVPQIGMTYEPYEVVVQNTEQAAFLLAALAEYDLYQLANHIKPDYANMGGLEVYHDGEWAEWEDENGEGIENVMDNAPQQIGPFAPTPDLD